MLTSGSASQPKSAARPLIFVWRKILLIDFHRTIDVDIRCLEVPEHAGFGCLRLSCSDGVNNFCVLSHDLGKAAFVAEAEIAHTIELRLAAQYGAPRLVVPGNCEDSAMKCLVELVKINLATFSSFYLLCDDLAQIRNILG